MPKQYDLILADSPWRYDNMQQNDPKRGGITYPTLTMQELYDIPLYKAAKDDSILVTWVTLPKLIDSYYSIKEKVGGISGNTANPISIIHSWGFRPVTALFVWVKLNPRGYIRPHGTLDFDKSEPYWEEDKTDANEYQHIRINDLYSGLGQYTNSNVEIAIIARRGKALPRLSKKVKQLIFAPIREHSAKPQVQYKRLSELYGDDIDCLEIFARKQNPPPSNYDATGLDYDGMDIRDWIKQYDR